MPVCWVKGLVGLVAVSETADEAGPTGLVTPSRPSPQASRGVWLLLIFLAPGLWSTVRLSRFSLPKNLSALALNLNQICNLC